MKNKINITCKRSEINKLIDNLTHKDIVSINCKALAIAIDKNFEELNTVLQETRNMCIACEEERGTISNEYNEFEQELMNKYAVKDVNGSPIITNGSFTIDDKQLDSFNKEREEGRVKFADEIEKMDVYNDHLEAIMNMEVNVTLIKLSVSELPERINAKEYRLLKPFII